MNPANALENSAVALRARLRKARTDLPVEYRRRGSLLLRGRLFTWLNLARDAAARAGGQGPDRIAAFWPLADEPDLRPLLAQWAEAGLTVALPVVHERAAPLVFGAWTPATILQPGPYGVLEPRDEPPVVPDVILVPTLGYTAHGDRLGYGGGYYDRTLTHLRAHGHTFTAIGIAWSCGELGLDYLPAPHDVRLDAILTPDGWTPQAP